ncbi:MAG TPA: hypothetical protein VF457_04925, partial [Burkholderiaceae bacterium]
APPPDTEHASSTVLQMSSFHPDHRTGRAFRMRIASRIGILEDARALLNWRYRRKGYGSQTLTLADHQLTIVAYDGTETAGTLTVRVDGAEGLLSEESFPEEIGRLRAGGLRLCEFGKLATDSGPSSMVTLVRMFHVGLLYGGDLHGLTHVIVEVNPRHAGFYAKVLGFDELARTRESRRVRAPGVLMLGELARIDEEIRRHRGAPAAADQRAAFYSFALSERDADDVRRRLGRALRGRARP